MNMSIFDSNGLKFFFFYLCSGPQETVFLSGKKKSVIRMIYLPINMTKLKKLRVNLTKFQQRYDFSFSFHFAIVNFTKL